MQRLYIGRCQTFMTANLEMCKCLTNVNLHKFFRSAIFRRLSISSFLSLDTALYNSPPDILPLVIWDGLLGIGE